MKALEALSYITVHQYRLIKLMYEVIRMRQTNGKVASLGGPRPACLCRRAYKCTQCCFIQDGLCQPVSSNNVYQALS